MEDNQDAESKKSEVQFLGRLQFTLDYEFQKQEVNRFFIFNVLQSKKRSKLACLT
jgi:hypothetical protein